MSLENPFPIFYAVLVQQLEFVLHLLSVIYGALPSFVSTLVSNPSLLEHPTQLRDRFFESVWLYLADGVDEASAESKRDLITPRANGIVLDIGAGLGHSAKYLDHTKVTSYYALEPNAAFHDQIRVNATLSGLAPSSISVIPHNAGDSEAILASLGGQQVDTVLCILTLCGIPDAERALADIVQNVLKPGGQVLFYEHVSCDVSRSVAWWQSFWSPAWEFIVGCKLDKPSHKIIDNLPVKWKESETWGKKDEPAKIFWHQGGRYVKA
ncbi:S-adenosyl-L-methionine-dependent methyltransferase [Cylindrobasidium torrendii FP15055 ss-10]|uniref:S-adenosyl-L-methionine-dependent methyltransferase n=1 Tax=Cylindrobasidium torrendii FP15055 ss-10 TaxID=1314674 RepID=A0A0D7BMA8_9AGAR|nr:S-adenosyl-L-methionine-dependent methyltransferase [Cylindrobasidium torrendii FP15055 ss-10]